VKAGRVKGELKIESEKTKKVIDKTLGGEISKSNLSDKRYTSDRQEDD
jgi:hypothetical protein